LVTRSARGAVIADVESLHLPGADLAGLAAQTSIRQLFEVRKLMEVRVAGWALCARAPKILKPCARDRSRRRTKYSRRNPNRLFHDALAKAAHNPALVLVYESGRHLFFRLPFYWKLFDDAQVKMTRAERHEMARRWHEQISKQSSSATRPRPKCMFQHLDIMEKDLLARLQSTDGDGKKSPALIPNPLLADLDPERKKIPEGNR